MLKDAYHLRRMLAVVVPVTRDVPEDPFSKTFVPNSTKRMRGEGERVTVGYRFKVAPGGSLIAPEGTEPSAWAATLTEQMRAATRAPHTRIINRMKTLVGQENLSAQAIKELSDLQTQQESVAAIAVFVYTGMTHRYIRAEAAGIDILFTDKTQAYDLLAAYNDVIEPYMQAALHQIQVQLTAAILRAERPAP